MSHQETQPLPQETILSAVAFAAEKLLSDADWREHIQTILDRLGNAAAASRIYIFERQADKPNGICDQTYEWVTEGIKPEIDNPELQNLPMAEFFPRWVEHFERRSYLFGFVKDFPESERQILEPQLIQSILIVPIIVSDQWWGFIGFDECTGLRHWTQAEVEILRTAASNLASAIRRQQTETLLRQTVKDLQTAKRIAEDNDRLKSEFLATMSHELRTPLNAIEGFTGIMLGNMGVELHPRARDMVERIAKNSKRLLRLINDFLDLTRIESGRMELVKESLAPEELAAKWRDQIEAQYRKANLALHTAIDANLPPQLYGDEEALSKIVLNLLDNALKFTPQGEVHLKLKRLNDTQWAIEVSDTGIGIPPHAREFIFDEFRQVDQTSKRTYGGAGLGLAIVQKMARTMGGTITLQSEVGQGSVFTVTLPLHTTL